MRTTLISLSFELPLNLDKFEELCHKTGDLIVDNYPWLPMTATVHKILVHSKQLLENTVLPAGYFGEEAAEARNKIYNSDRLHHARKHNRICVFTDVFHRAMHWKYCQKSLQGYRRSFKNNGLKIRAPL